jgi:hypothetical protein
MESEDATPADAALRPHLAQFASSMIYPWLHEDSTIESLHAIKRGLSCNSQFVRRSSLSSLLRIDEDQMNVLLDILSDVSDTGAAAVRSADSSGESELVDFRRLLLLLVIHIHLKHHGKSSEDVWPNKHHQAYHHQMEPSSPLKLHQKSFAGGSQASSVGVMPDEHVQQTRRLGEFLANHVDDILRLIADGDGHLPMSGHELQRLEFLLTRAPASTENAREALQRCVKGDHRGHSDHIGGHSDHIGGHSNGIIQGNGSSLSDSSTPGQDRSPDGVVLIHGVHKLTVIRGEDEVGKATSLRIVDCHDSVIYVLAPLKWVQVVSCTNSIVVLGAVGQSLRMEYCERLQMVSVASHIVINTCHDCIVYAASNRPPLLVGDNRFVQLAPYNSGYDNLERHMRLAGISADVNSWDRPVTLMPEKPVFKHHPQENLQIQHQLDHSMSVTLLPPEKIMPFVIPFKGGPGPLCGGSAAPLTRGTSNDTLTGLLTQDFVDFCPCPFPLPRAYVDAWKARMAGISMVKEAYKNAKLSAEQKQAFTSSVQGFFKEWLQHGGGMREVYDLAKVEKGLSSKK